MSDLPDFPGAIAEFTLVVAKVTLNAASKTAKPGDRVACLRATHHSGRAYAALRRARRQDRLGQ